MKGNNRILLEGIKFSNGPLRCLGIYTGTDKDMCEKKKWENKLHEINNILSIWSSRNLNLYGKVVILNNLIIPKLIYNMTVLPVPLYVIQRLEDLIYKFLWGKTHKIVKSVVIAKCENGGLNLTDMNVKHYALKSSWIRKLLEQNSITEVLNMYLSSIGITINLMLKMNFRKIESFNAINKIQMFYQQIFLSYNMCKTIKPINQMNNFEIFSRSIWGNELFKTKEKCLFFKNWINSGFLLVKDLFDNDGTFISTEKVLNKLKNKSNWITEFFVLKNVIHKKVTKIGDPSICLFIQNSCYKDVSFISTHGIVHPENISTKDMYQTLVEKKAKRSYTESMWQKKTKFTD